MRAAEWVTKNRGVPGGGFRHDATDHGGPYLEDTLSMGDAFLALYRSTADRRYLAQSVSAMSFIERQFRDPSGGYISAPAPSNARGVFRHAVRPIDQNVAVTRFANRLHWITGSPRYAQLARHGMNYVVAASAATPDQLHTEVLLADHELAGPPIHITIVGGKNDPAAQLLHASALQFPSPYLQVDWWDRTEGPLPNREIRYPTLPRPAAFACTQNSCSTPVFEASQISGAVRALLQDR